MGLFKTAAKVAVASSVHGRVQRRQQTRWAAQDHAEAQTGVAAPPPPAPYPAPAQPQQAYPEPVLPPPAAAAAPARPADMGEQLAQLKQLGELLQAGVLTQAEFDQQKTRILNG